MEKRGTETIPDIRYGSFATELDGRKSGEVSYAAEAEANSEGKLLPGGAMRPLCSPMSLSSAAASRVAAMSAMPSPA